MPTSITTPAIQNGPDPMPKSAVDIRNAYDAAVASQKQAGDDVTDAQNTLNAKKAAKTSADGVVVAETTEFATVIHTSQFQMVGDYSKVPPVIYTCTDGKTIQELQVPDLSTVTVPDEEPTPTPTPTPTPEPEPAPAPEPPSEPVQSATPYGY